MITNLLLYNLLLFTITFVLLKYFITNAKKYGLMDIPNERSAHKEPVARGAGMIFGFVFIVSLFLFFYFSNIDSNYIYIFISLLIVFFTGIYDDFNDISSRKKFIFIIIATIIAFSDGFAINSLGNYFSYELSLGYLALPFTIFAVVGFTNAINLSDGLDGLAGSISIIILLALAYIGYHNDDQLLTYVPIYLSTTILAFLWFNWYPAKVFMGDSGSLFLGFVIALLSIYALKYINPSSILFLAAIPLLDTLMVMKRRRQRGNSLFVADKNHLHHIILSIKKDKLFTVASLLKMQVIFTLIFIQVYDKSGVVNLLLFVMLFFIFFSMFDPRAGHRPKEKKNKRRLRKSN